ncbi:hypothetical protein [Hymenobacter baengnokdamensis]|uniref:hypothetical protein n=1 Tax=Hymenobacter baengnokdamensis TaxID=2615203 RepID=UPI0012480BFF|nr:hypothetical protein [Hymenobacter baengnokdamensis]
MRASFAHWLLGSLLAAALPLAAGATRPSVSIDPPAAEEEFIQTCNARLDLTDEQRTGLRAYLEQEIDYMAVQAANHSAAEVAELVPAEREQLQRVAGHLLSPGQLRQFRELEATPRMREYLKEMSLAD